MSFAAAWGVDQTYHFAARKTEAWGWRASGAGLIHPLLPPPDAPSPVSFLKASGLLLWGSCCLLLGWWRSRCRPHGGRIASEPRAEVLGQPSGSRPSAVPLEGSGSPHGAQPWQVFLGCISLQSSSLPYSVHIPPIGLGDTEPQGLCGLDRGPRLSVELTPKSRAHIPSPSTSPRRLGLPAPCPRGRKFCVLGRSGNISYI